MVLPQAGYLLRIFLGEADKHEGRPLYEWLVLRARERGLAGATVVRGLMGFGATSRLHTFKIERLSLDLPIVVEIVDTREKLETFLAEIDPVIHEGLATLEKAEVRFYRSRENPAAPPQPARRDE
jgi:PII-like signaling protein